VFGSQHCDEILILSGGLREKRGFWAPAEHVTWTREFFPVLYSKIHSVPRSKNSPSLL